MNQVISSKPVYDMSNPFISSLLLIANVAFAQSTTPFTVNPENLKTMEEIWAVERVECLALQSGDSIRLRKIRAVDFVQNYQEDIEVGNKKFPKYSYVSRTNKSVWVSDGFVFSTGDESLIPLADELYAGKVMTRRYTHVWEKQNGAWRLKTRFVSEI